MEWFVHEECKIILHNTCDSAPVQSECVALSKAKKNCVITCDLKIISIFVHLLPEERKMFKSVVPILAQVPAEVCLGQQNRGMATLKSIQIRLKSVKNIQKITQSMKMVSAAKYAYTSLKMDCLEDWTNAFLSFDYRYARAERDLKQARPYGLGAQQFYEKAEVTSKEEQPKKLYIAITSDRGKWVEQTRFFWCRLMRI